MTDNKTQPASSKWKDALLWAILSALVSQLGEEYLLGRSVRQDLNKVETDLRQIEHELTPCAGVK